MNYSKKYFNQHTPVYSIKRLGIVIKWLNQIKNKNISLLDVGCGDGSNLRYISEKTGIQNLIGIDESDKLIKIAKHNFKAKFFCTDILRPKNLKTYDAVMLMAVLHHLIGSSRGKSKKLSEKAIKNCLRILNEDGRLIIFEPVFSNRIMMDILFYLKKIFSKITNERLIIGGYGYSQ